MAFDIHITVELQPSSQLVELLQSWQPDHKIRPQPGPQGSTPIDSNPPKKPAIGDIKALLKVSSEQPKMPSMGETERLLRPKTKSQEAGERPKTPDQVPQEPPQRDPLVEIPKFSISECTTKKHIPVPGTSPHFEYIETTAGRLWFRYISGNIWTTWDQIMKLERSLPANQKNFGKLLHYSDRGNRRTAINYMIKAIRAGLVAGQADPDADFRTQLPPGTIDTSTGYDGGKLEGSLGD